MWNRASYRRLDILSTDEGNTRELRKISQSLWGGLSLATADDEADSGSIDAQQFRQRLRYVFELIAASFQHFICGGDAERLRMQESQLCQSQDLQMDTRDVDDLRQFVSRHAPRPHTIELDVNTCGAIIFGRSLAAYVKQLQAGGTSSRRIFHLIHLLSVTLYEGIDGQVRSLSLIDGRKLSFGEFLQISQNLALPVAKVLTFLRSPDSYEKVRVHYKRYDPTIFQFVLDDLPDYFEDSAAGKIGILHALILEQAELGSKALAAIEGQRDFVELIGGASMNFLCRGNWSSTVNYVNSGCLPVAVPILELRCALENCRKDADMKLAAIASKRVDLGRRLASALDRRDPEECARVLLQSKVLKKVVSGVWEDQSNVQPVEGVTSKAVSLFPLVTGLLVAKCHLAAWGYSKGWRMRWTN
jgi:hypothetical protein